LLEQWSIAVGRTGLSSDRLRLWLERALQIGHHPYQTAADAYADLSDLPPESTAAAFELLTGDVDAPPAGRRLLPAQQPTGREISTANASAPARVRETAPATVPPRLAAAPATAPPRPAPIRSSEPAPQPARTAPPAVRGATARRTALKVRQASPWIAAALGLLALVETGVIAALMMRQPAVTTTALRAAEPQVPIAGSEPLSAPVVQLSAVAPPAAPVTNEAPPPTATAPDPLAAASNQRSGGVQLQTPIELKVLHGDEVLGSSADGPIVMRAGTYQLDLINTTLGLRMRRSVTFREGQLTRLDIPLPMGRVSVNAQPWAEVSIDNRVYGETPLANLSVPIGNHEILFRHPDLGERRQTITVRADGETRVAATLGR